MVLSGTDDENKLDTTGVIPDLSDKDFSNLLSFTTEDRITAGDEERKLGRPTVNIPLSESELADLTQAERRNLSCIGNLHNRHYEIIRMSVLGLKNVEIAEALGISTASVAMTLNNPLAKRHIQNLLEARDESVKDVKNGFAKLLPSVLQNYAEVLQNGGGISKQAQEMGDSVLDRLGYARQKNLSVTSNHTTMVITAEDIAKITERRAAMLKQADAIDIQPQQMEG